MSDNKDGSDIGPKGSGSQGVHEPTKSPRRLQLNVAHTSAQAIDFKTHKCLPTSQGMRMQSLIALSATFQEDRVWQQREYNKRV